MAKSTFLCSVLGNYWNDIIQSFLHITTKFLISILHKINNLFSVKLVQSILGKKTVLIYHSFVKHLQNECGDPIFN